MTKVKGLFSWDNKGTLQHMAKMAYMSERGDRLEGLAVRSCIRADDEMNLTVLVTAWFRPEGWGVRRSVANREGGLEDTRPRGHLRVWWRALGPGGLGGESR